MKKVYLNIGNQADIARYNQRAARLAIKAGTVAIRIESAYRTKRMVEDTVTICVATGSTIGLIGGPFNNWQKPYLPKGVPASYRGPWYEEHLMAYNNSYAELSAWMGERKDLVKLIAFDIERWQVSTKAESKALAESYDRVIDQAYEYFPDARVSVYDLGIWWGQTSKHWPDGVQRLESVAVSLACPAFPDEMAKWVDVARESVLPVVAWVHCGCGYAKLDWKSYTNKLAVEPANAIQIGNLLATTPEVESVVIHPGPTGTKEWDDHLEHLLNGLGA